MKKKLEEFLELEKKSSSEPWYASEDDNTGFYVDNIDCIICDTESIFNEENDAQFIAQSRTIAPLAVNKLMEAVELIEKIIPAAKFLSCKSYPENEVDSCFHCCDWEEWLKRAKQFMEDFNNEK